MTRLLVIIDMILAVLIYGGGAYAAELDPSFRSLHAGLLVEAGKARGLSIEDSKIAVGVAAYWVFIGPCSGKEKDIPNGRSGVSVIQWVMTAKPSENIDAAIMEMITIMIRESIGRDPGPQMCEFARQTAALFQP